MRGLITAAAVLALAGCGKTGNEVGRSDTLKNPSAALNPVDLNWEAPSSKGVEILPEVTPIAEFELESWLGRGATWPTFRPDSTPSALLARLPTTASMRPAT